MPLGDVWGNSWGDSWNDFWADASDTQSLTPDLFVNTSIVYEPRVNIGSPAPVYPPNVCMRSGFKVRPGELYRDWNGLMVRAEDYDGRHPQDFVRGRRDWQHVPQPRPEPTEHFLETNDVTRESL